MQHVEQRVERRKRCGYRGRALRGLVWAVTAFACSQAALGLSVRAGWVPVQDLVFANKVRPLEKHRAFGGAKTPGRPTTILALGSSRTMSGLDARRLGGALTRDTGRPTVAFNFGIPAAGPITTNLYLRRLLAEDIRPDFVLVEVLPPFLAGQLEAPMEARWLQTHRVRGAEFDLLARWGFALKQERPAAWQYWLAGSYLHRSALLSQAVPNWVPYDQVCDTRRVTDAYGWVSQRQDEVTPEQYQKGLSNAQRQYERVLARFDLGGPACGALADLLDLGRREGIATAILLMPEGTDFRAMYPAEALRQVDAFLLELRRTFDVPVIDARLWLADTYFADGHHLLRGGAEHFTERLALELPRLPNFPRREAAGGSP